MATRIFSSVEPVHSRRLNFRTNYDTFLRVVYRVIAAMNFLILGNWILKNVARIASNIPLLYNYIYTNVYAERIRDWRIKKFDERQYHKF